jgi:hypothetical protein
MSSNRSEQMICLLEELAAYKAMDKEYISGPRSSSDTEAYEKRGRRRREITLEMHRLAAETKGSTDGQPS